MGDDIRGKTGDDADNVNVGKDIHSERSEFGRQTVTIRGGELTSALQDMRSELRSLSQQMVRLASIENNISQLKDRFGERISELDRDIERMQINTNTNINRLNSRIDNTKEQLRSRVNTVILIGSLIIVGMLSVGAITMWLYLTPNLTMLNRRIDLNNQRIERIERTTYPTPFFIP